MRRRGRYEGKEVLEDRNTGKVSPKANEVKEANDKGEWKDGGGGVISSSLTPPPPSSAWLPTEYPSLLERWDFPGDAPSPWDLEEKGERGC